MLLYVQGHQSPAELSSSQSFQHLPTITDRTLVHGGRACGHMNGGFILQEETPTPIDFKQRDAANFEKRIWLVGSDGDTQRLHPVTSHGSFFKEPFQKFSMTFIPP